MTPTRSPIAAAGWACRRKNLLYFIEKTSPRLQSWEREILGSCD